MRKKLFALALVLALKGVTGNAQSKAQDQDTRTFPVQPGDTLVINNDFGKIYIRPADGSNLQVKIRKTLPDSLAKDSIGIQSRKSGGIVSLETSFSGAAGQAVDLEIQAPKRLNVTIAGKNCAVDLAGLEGTVHVQESAGNIVADSLTSAVSLTTDSGSISYRTDVQPLGDVHLESTSGNIYCELVDGLRLKSWIRAGGSISWDMDPTLQATTLEKELGTRGPLLYAASLKGNVVVRVKPAAVPVLPAIALSAPGQPVAMPATSAEPVPAKAPEAPVSASAPTTVPSSGSRPVLSPPVPVGSASGAQVAAAQSTPPQQAKREASPGEGQAPVVLSDTLKVNVDSVFLNVSVRDRDTSRSVAGLRKEDFTIYEDGVKQQVAQFFPSEAPFNLLLLLDTSGSTESYVGMMKKAAIDFTRQIKETDRIAVATFSNGVQLAENFTNDRSAAERAINHIKSGGGTAFYDALRTCLDRYMRGIEGRSAILVFTDGVDNQLEGKGGSVTTYDQLYRRVQESDTIIYTIFLDTEGQMASRGPMGRPGGGGWPGGGRGRRYPGGGFPFPLPVPQPYPSPSPSPSPYPRGRQQNERAVYEEARDQLMEIAEQTGGRMYTPHKIDELSGVYSEIADDLRIQYELGYNSTNRAHDGAWREIRVEVMNHPGAVVRTRKGYYARKDNS